MRPACSPALHAENARRPCLPVSSAAGLRCGLADRVLEGGPADYRGQVADLAGQLAWSPHYTARLAAKAQALTAAEKEFPLAAYRHQELAVMSRNFFDPEEPYAQLRRAFVYKDRPAQTPPHLSDRRILLGSNSRSR